MNPIGSQDIVRSVSLIIEKGVMNETHLMTNGIFQ